MASVSATMHFMAPLAEEPFYRSQPDEGFDSCNFSYNLHQVQVQDARPTRNQFSLDTHGFAYADDPEGAQYVEQLRKEEEGSKGRYYEHLKEVVKKQTGASRVIVFDHTMRRRDPTLAGKNPDGREQPAAYVHVDQ